MNRSPPFIGIFAVASAAALVGLAWLETGSALAKQDERSEMLDLMGTVADADNHGDTTLCEKVFFSGNTDQWVKAYLKGKPGESDRVWAKILAEIKDSPTCYMFICKLYKRVESDAPDDATNNSKYGILPFSQNLLAATEKCVGRNHRFVADILAYMCRHYDSVKDFQTSLALSRRELAIEEKALGPDGEGTGFAMLDVAFDLSELGRYAEAQQLLDRTLKLARVRKYERLLDPALRLQKQLSLAERRSGMRPLPVSK